MPLSSRKEVFVFFMLTSMTSVRALGTTLLGYNRNQLKCSVHGNSMDLQKKTANLPIINLFFLKGSRDFDELPLRLRSLRAVKGSSPGNELKQYGIPHTKPPFHQKSWVQSRQTKGYPIILPQLPFVEGEGTSMKKKQPTFQWLGWVGRKVIC